MSENETPDKREKCCGEWDSLAGRCTDCPHDKESTPRTDALIEEALKFADTPWAYTDEERKAFRKKLLMSHSQLERELAMMTKAHETCKRCFADAERALSARGPTLPSLPEVIQEWCWHMDLHLTEHDERHAAMALRAAWPHVSKWLKENVAPSQGGTPYVGEKK